jgi:hypothetical protein
MEGNTRRETGLLQAPPEAATYYVVKHSNASVVEVDVVAD